MKPTAWRRAIAAQPVRPGLRVVKATMAILPVAADGTIREWRDDLIQATGLPAGTLKRHLVLAVEAGWLVHEVRGGRGRRGLYRVTLPDGNSGPRMSHKSMDSGPRPGHKVSNSGPSTTPLSGRIVAHAVGQSIKEREPSEHVAVDNHRGTQLDHDEQRACRKAEQEHAATKGKQAGNRFLLVASVEPSSLSTAADAGSPNGGNLLGCRDWFHWRSVRPDGSCSRCEDLAVSA